MTVNTTRSTTCTVRLLSVMHLSLSRTRSLTHSGYLPSRLVSFLMNVHLTPIPIFFTRHGESEFNLSGRIGGDADLSPLGKKYAKCLGQLVASRTDLPADRLVVWHSTLLRAQSTAHEIKASSHWAWKSLEEIDAGA
jgi:hypothetical protein